MKYPKAQCVFIIASPVLFILATSSYVKSGNAFLKLFWPNNSANLPILQEVPFV